jgi:AAA domain
VSNIYPFPPVNPSPDLDAIRKHLEWLTEPAREHYGDALIEIAYDTKGDGAITHARLFPIARIADGAAFAAYENAAGSNVYLGVLLKRPETPQGKRTKAADSYVGTAIPNDADRGAAAVLAKLAALGVAPGVSIVTGRVPEERRQVWFRLTEPSDNLSAFKQAFDNLVETTGGDMNARGLNRLMRLGGSICYPPGYKRTRGYVVEASDFVLDESAAPIALSAFLELGSSAKAGARASECLSSSTRAEWVNDAVAVAAVSEYLTSAPPSIERSCGRANAIKVLQHCQDLGCDFERSLDLMIELWNDRCEPPWGDQAALAHELRGLGRRDPIGCDHPIGRKEASDQQARDWYEDPDEFAARERQRKAEAEPLFPKESTSDADASSPYLTGPARAQDPALMPKRPMLYGSHYMRGFASATIAPTKVGKSSLIFVEALAMATGRPLLGVTPVKPLRVWIWNGEDPQDELEKRLEAAKKHYGIPWQGDELGGRLFLGSGRAKKMRLVVQGKSGPALNLVVMREVIETVRKFELDVLFVDPFVKTHGVSENDSGAMDLIMDAWADIADQTRCAVEIVHHTRKMNGREVTTEDARGSSAIKSATRAARALTKMSEDESKTLGLGDVYRRLFRFNDISENMAAPPVTEKTQWLELVSVNLGNGAMPGENDMIDALLDGDEIGVVRLFKMPSSEERAASALGNVEGVAEREQTIMAALASGDWRKDPRAGDGWAGVPIAQAYDMDLSDPKDKTWVKNLLQAWLKERKIREITRPDKNRVKRSFIEVCNSSVQAEGEIDLFS